MSGGQSTWALAPERGLELGPKEEPQEWDNVWNDPPTFQPEMLSDPDIRAKVKSSGYGTEQVTVARVELEDTELRPWQEVPTFKPDISPDPLRESAKSSAYGEVVPKKVYKKPPKPKFKPQISRSKSSAKLQSEVPSSAYGVKAALPPRPASAPRPTFKPKMKKCKVRAAASSSGYGKKAAVSPASLRPSTAPANGVRREFVPRYSLAADRAPTEEKEPTERERGFVLDAVALNNTRSPLVAAFPSPTKVKPTAHGKKLKSETASSDYFNAAPVTVPRPETAPAEPSLRFDRATSALLAELPPGPQKTALADKARSSKYGEASPAVGEKLEVPEPEPLWKPALVAAIPASEEMPEAPVNALTAKASSHRYGREAPEVGDMYETVSEPIWMPAGPGRPIPAPEPVARYNTGDAVQSHYGNGYAPANPYREEEEEEFEEEVEGGARVLSRTVAGDEERASGEYDQDGYPDEGESY